jgi:hypothetical protein
MAAGEHLFSASPGPAQRDLPGGTPGRVIACDTLDSAQIGHDGRASSAAAGLSVMTKPTQGIETPPERRRSDVGRNPRVAVNHAIIMSLSSETKKRAISGALARRKRFHFLQTLTTSGAARHSICPLTLRSINTSA